MYLIIQITQDGEDLNRVYDIGRILLKHMNLTDSLKSNIKEVCISLNRMDIYKLVEDKS